MDPPPGGAEPGFLAADKVAYWDGCRQTLEAADDRVNQIVSSVLTYIPALAAAGLTVLTVTAASDYVLGYIAGVIIGIAGLGMTHQSNEQADSAFDTLYAALDVVERVEGKLGIDRELLLATQIGVIRRRRLNGGPDSRDPKSLRNRFDRFCTGLYVAFLLVAGVSAAGLVLAVFHL